MKSVYELLYPYPIFNCLRPALLNYLSVNSWTMKLEKNDFLERNRKTIYFLVSGNIKICEMDYEGDEVIKYLLREGNFFGESSNTYYRGLHEFAKGTSGEVRMVAVPKLIINELRESEPEFSMYYSQLVSKKCAAIENQLRTLMLKDTRHRLLRFLYLMAQSEGKEIDNQVVVQNYLTHNEIASLIGTTRVTVTKFLSELRSSGKISYNRQEFKLAVTDTY